jgi:plastocyanin
MVTAYAQFSFAEIHDVAVKDNKFKPKDLIINPGGTVRWKSSTVGCGDGYGPDCVEHTVTADDFSFSSGAPSEDIFFTRNFDEIGVILYHCEAHSQPGQDINSFMNGRITVQDEPLPLQFNAGLNDAWYNPDTDGQGFFITIFPQLEVVTLAWFTYDTDLPTQEETANLGDPGHRWLTALGSIEGSQSVMTISFASGGLFDMPTDITRDDGGSIILTFENCSTGSIAYDIPSIERQGVVPIQRVAGDNIILCEALDAE